jgi:hypothetical protein
MSEGQVKLDNEIVINKTDAILGDKIFGIEDLVTGSIDSNDSSNLVKETVKDILNSDAIEEILKDSKDLIDATNLRCRFCKKKAKERFRK